MTSTLNRLLLSLAAGSVLSGLVDANGSIVSAYLTPLTTLALNAARATGTLDAAAFNQAVIALLNAFGLAAGLDILHTAPVVTGTSIDYGPALLNISRMVAAGLPLAQILSTPKPPRWPQPMLLRAPPPSRPVPPCS